MIATVFGGPNLKLAKTVDVEFVAPGVGKIACLECEGDSEACLRCRICIDARGCSAKRLCRLQEPRLDLRQRMMPDGRLSSQCVGYQRRTEL